MYDNYNWLKAQNDYNTSAEMMTWMLIAAVDLEIALPGVLTSAIDLFPASRQQ